MRRKKYWKSRKDALKHRDELNKLCYCNRYHVFKMPNGSKHQGWYAVCDEIEYLNTL